MQRGGPTRGTRTSLLPGHSGRAETGGLHQTELPTMQTDMNGSTRTNGNGQGRSALTRPAGATRSRVLIIGVALGIALGAIACTQPGSTTAPGATTGPASTS